MDYQETIEIIEYASAFNSENSRLTKALSVAITAMQELQSLHEQGISLERLKDIDFRKEVVEHINYMECMSIKDELEEYKQLGTLEEVRDAMEKQEKKKPLATNRCYVCPHCGLVTSIKIKHNYCDACGQHIDWSEEDD